MPPKRVQRSRSRQTTPQSPPKVQSSHQPSQRSSRATRSRSRDQLTPTQKSGTEKLLAAVDEEHEPEDEIIVARGMPASEVESSGRDSNLRDDSDDDLSDSSSNGSTQLEALDTDMIFDNLLPMYDWSKKILSMLGEGDVPERMKDLEDPTSRLRKRLQNSLLQFSNVRPAFGGGAYIDVSLIRRKLAKDISDARNPSILDAILHIANLTTLCMNLAQGNNDNGRDTLERMFNTFPEPFGHFEIPPNSTTYRTRMIRETVSVGLSLRTQFLIEAVDTHRGDTDFDASQWLNNVFYDEEGRLNAFQAEEDDPLPAVGEMVLTYFQTMGKQYTNSVNKPASWTRFKKHYSGVNLLAETFAWAAASMEELDAEVAASGGVDKILKHLRRMDLPPRDKIQHYNTDEANRPATNTKGIKEPTARTSIATINRDSVPNSTPASSIMLQRTMRLKEIKAQQDEQDEDSQESNASDKELPLVTQKSPIRNQSHKASKVAAPEIPQTPDLAGGGLMGRTEGDDYNPMDNDDIDGIDEADSQAEQESPSRSTHPTIVPTQQTLNVLAVAQEQEEMRNKENLVDGGLQGGGGRRRYTDKQANAKRLAWEESQTATQTASKHRNRTVDDEAEDEDDDGEEDDEFEVDIRPQKRIRREVPNVEHADDSLFFPENSDEEGGQEEEEDEDEEEEYNDTSYRSSEVSNSRQVRKVLAAPLQMQKPNANSRRGGSMQPPRSRKPLQEMQESEPRKASKPPTSSAPARTATHRPRRASAASSTDISANSSIVNSNSTLRDSPPPLPPGASRPPPSTAPENYGMINQIAKENMRVSRYKIPTQASTDGGSNNNDNNGAADYSCLKPQVRRAWTAEETTRLFEMIRLHGCQWATILAMDKKRSDGGQLQNRNQVQLKDKARNMKMDYLKSGLQLPAGFWAVSIKDADKKMLKSLNLPIE